MLRWRLLLGTLLTALLVCLVWLDYQLDEFPGLVLVPLAVILAVMAAGELLSMWAASGRQVARWPVLVGTALIVAANGPPVLFDFPQFPTGSLGWPLLALAVAGVGVLAVEICRYREALRLFLLQAHLGAVGLYREGRRPGDALRPDIIKDRIVHVV